MTSSHCAFCCILEGTEPAKVLLEEKDSIVIEPLNPVTPGHVLVIPRKHVPDFTADLDVTAATMRSAASFAASFPDWSFNLITSKGADATQSVFHLHVHLVPRRWHDGLHLPWTPRFVEGAGR